MTEVTVQIKGRDRDALNYVLQNSDLSSEDIVGVALRFLIDHMPGHRTSAHNFIHDINDRR